MKSSTILSLAVLATTASAFAATPLVNEQYWDGTTPNLATWTGPNTLTGNSTAVAPTKVGTSMIAQTGNTLTWTSGTGGGFRFWDSANANWTENVPASGQPQAGYWSNAVNKTIPGSAFTTNRLTVVKTTAWSNIMRNNSENFKTILHLTDESGVAGIQFQTTFNPGGSAVRPNRFSSRIMAEPGSSSNVIEPFDGTTSYAWNGNFANFAIASGATNETVLGQLIGQEYVVRPVNLVGSATTDFKVEARATNTVGVGGTTNWQASTLTKVGQYTDSTRTSLNGIDGFSRVFASVMRNGQSSTVQNTLPGIGGTNTADHQTGFGSIVIFETSIADFDHDGKVGVGDLGILASNWSAAVSFQAQGDANGDGLVDVGDLGALASDWNFGAGDATLSFSEALALFPNISTAVPEPASLALLGLGALALVRRRR